MNEVLRQKLDKIAIAKGWDSNDDEVIVEIIRYGKTLKKYGHDKHRWYTLFSRVVQIEDFFVDFQDYENSGDEPALDSKERTEMILSSVVEVFKKQVTVADYVTKDEL